MVWCNLCAPPLNANDTWQNPERSSEISLLVLVDILRNFDQDILLL